MDLQTRKIEFVQEFLKLENEEIVAILEVVMKQQTANTEDAFKPMTIDELNARIDKSEDDFKNGRYKSTEELLDKYR
ncbi:hypothetical protein ACLI09_00640 [Flavobacterium sp. RHBU_24]|uniref:hypothetical protein n=1 Tax=Flavobacterium sp. RHBU_24 TaxID=3391185 RepID=UPI003984DB9D